MNPQELLTRRVDKILPSPDALRSLLESGKKLRLYQGFDPSKPDLHIGHLVGLLQLRAFQDLGHEVIFLIGDFTGRIGDPTDKSATRPKLTKEEVKQNAQTYKDQAGKILRFDGENAAQMKFNSQWLDQLTFADVIELASHFTVQQMIERDMFQERLKANTPIFLHEFLYPLMVTYDAQVMEVDLEVGGTDQLFNMSVGRHYLKDKVGKDKFVLTTKLLTDSQGRKIGKTTGNAINLFGDPRNLYGQIMALSDDVIIPAFTLATTLTLEKITKKEALVKTNPLQAKKDLAFAVTQMCHGDTAALSAQTHFEATVQSDELPPDIPSVQIHPQEALSLLELCRQAGVGESSGQIKRTIIQGGVELDGTKILDPNQAVSLKSGSVLKFGKRDFRRLQLNHQS